jgi:hypothetical protein
MRATWIHAVTGELRYSDQPAPEGSDWRQTRAPVPGELVKIGPWTYRASAGEVIIASCLPGFAAATMRLEGPEPEAPTDGKQSLPITTGCQGFARWAKRPEQSTPTPASQMASADVEPGLPEEKHKPLPIVAPPTREQQIEDAKGDLARGFPVSPEMAAAIAAEAQT